MKSGKISLVCNVPEIDTFVEVTIHKKFSLYDSLVDIGWISITYGHSGFQIVKGII